MSGTIFPPCTPVSGFPGQQLTKYRRPTANTHTQRALSGKESRIALRPYPLMEWELSFDWLPDNTAPAGLGRYNFIPYSQDFTQWGAHQAGAGLLPVVVGNYVGTAAPDGTYTADRVILNASPGSTGSDNSFLSFAASTSPPLAPAIGKTGTFSVWLATADGSTVQVALAALGGGATVVTVNGAWQRFSVIETRAAAGTNLGQILVNAGGATSKYADLLAWGAQTELGSSATRYIPTNGAPLRQSDFASMLGLFTGMLGQWDTFLYQDPDFNTIQLAQFATGDGATTAFNLTAAFQPLADFSQYGGVGGLAGQPEWVQNCNGLPAIYTARYGFPELLSTGSRTNLALHSPLNTGWTLTNATSTANAATGPDGTSDATQVTDNVTNGSHAISQASLTITANGRYTFSVWLKYVSHQFLNVIIDNSSTDRITLPVDLLNGLLGSVLLTGTAYGSQADATLTAGPNGWFRVAISGQLATADTSARVAIAYAQNLTTAGFPGYAGSGTDQFLCWGAQLEAGTMATALIPTTTTSANNGGADYSLTNLTSAGTAVQTFQQVQFASAPALNTPLLWTGSFFYRVRFSEDTIEPAEFLSGHWKLESLKIEQVLL